ncbi:dihydrofolate reductase family protein [Arthrobacter globiformis]|uniref:dihydrofolate reductase family protein n=1 Tax=Arthrobacter globiformis TaxID=1665 RepID=UPI00278183D8|nr:dihydrofolate reductase family protein [Arthrobacter globiformis]MDQ0867129.1 dihydrofolate reductase [Arthrobacter globiformis]
MARLVAEMTMSLDGFIALPDDSVNGLFDWYNNGPVEVRTARQDMTWHVTEASAMHLRRTMSTAGAMLVGRRIFDLTDGWGGRHPIDCPIVVLSHSVPDGWPRDEIPYTFVTTGFADAVRAATALAGDKDVSLAGPDIIRQAIDAGLVEEIRVNLAPWILGQGIRFFDNLAAAPVKLEQTAVIQGDAVTHLYYKVLPRI